jgi:hypothetical protein
VLTVAAGIPSWASSAGVSKQYVATASLTQTNPGAGVFATLFSPTSAGSLTIPANTFTPGSVLFFRISGIYAVGATASTGTMRILLGGSIITATPATTLVTNQANKPYNIEGVVTCRTNGITGTFVGSINASLNTANAPAGTNIFMGSTTTTATTLNTTGSLTLDVLFAYSSANASNVITAVTSFAYLAL